MWKPFLCRDRRCVVAEPGGLWLGDASYAVCFPLPASLTLSEVETGWLAGRLGRVVVDGVEPLPGGRLRLILDEGESTATVVVIPDPRAATLIGPLDGERIGVADPGVLGRAAKAAIATSAVGSAAVRIERGPRGGLLALPLAGDRALEPLHLRGELPEGLILPARTLRLAYWAGLREGLVSIARAQDGQFLVLAADEGGRRYRIA
jgi:hypothetical protein